MKYISIRGLHGKIQYVLKRGPKVKISDFIVGNGKHETFSKVVKTKISDFKCCVKKRGMPKVTWYVPQELCYKLHCKVILKVWVL